MCVSEPAWDLSLIHYTSVGACMDVSLFVCVCLSVCVHELGTEGRAGYCCTSEVKVNKEKSATVSLCQNKYLVER